MTTVETTPLPHVRVLFRPAAFDWVTNPGFETNTTGWSVSAGINAAATSITRITTDDHSGSASGSLVTTTTVNSGVNFDLGSTRFWQESTYGTAYVGLVWLKWVSGPTRARLILGSEGTSSDRATLTITDLAADWTPYRVVWYPSASRTDAQLAITTDVAAALTVLIDDASVYQIDAFSQVENGNFLSDTTGWATTAGINGAGTSITRGSGTGPATTTYATVVTTSTNGSGVNFDLGSRTFASGRTYRARVALKHGSGANVRLRLGSLGTGADRGDKTVAATTSWAWHYVDWTPSGSRTDAELAIGNAAASALTVDIGAVEVFEAIDEVNGDAGRADVSSLSWARSTDAVGTINATLHDPVDTHRYTPWYSSGALYGLLRPGLRVWARATFGGRLYPLAFGTIRRWVPDVHAGTCAVLAEDPMADIAEARVTMGFADDRSYRSARARLFGDTAWALGNDPVAGARRVSLTTAHDEQATFYDGTNGEVSALDYLGALNDATGTVHYVQPHATAEVLWQYVTVARSTLADAAGTSTTVTEDDLSDLTGMDLSDETVETVQAVQWQAYERLVVAGTRIAQARDPASYTSDIDADDPYLHFVVDAAGTDEDVVEPTFEREYRWKRRRLRKSKKRIRVRTFRYRRVYPDAFVPFTLSATTEKTWTMAFSVPVVIDGVTTAHPSATPATVAYTAASPREVTFRATATGASTTGSVLITGAAWTPLDEQTVTRTNHAGLLTARARPNPPTNTPYVGSVALAEGLARYREWRFGEARLRPTLRVEHATAYATALGIDPTSHLSITAARYALSSSVFVVTEVSGSVGHGGLMWAWEHTLEALPASIGTLFVLDTSTLGGAHVLGY